ncbi:hypothetical protein ES706_00914 [subsurface metagenome]|nr:hypothetical protein [Hadesarchaea archaeon]
MGTSGEMGDQMVSPVRRFGFSEEHAGLEDTLASIAERIRKQEGQRWKVAKALAGLRDVTLEGVEEIIEPFLVKPIEQDALANLTVAGVDGGMLEQQLHGLDLILLRAVVAIFRYQNSRLEWAKYFPSEMPFPRLIDVAEPLDAREFELLAGMERQLAEIELATEALRANEVKLLLLDGSVVPQYVDRFPHNQSLLERYHKLLNAYTKLYETCAESGALLAGAVKDSRGGRFVDILRRKVLPSLGGLGLEQKELEILERSRDTVLLDHVLGVGERTSIFRYAESPSRYVLRDLGEWAMRVYAFYIKTVPFDRPLRVEFIDFRDEPAETADRVAPLVYALSSHHDAFGLPSVLIEADVCARLTEEDLSIVRDSIADRLGPSALLDLRRHRRPF